MNFGKLNCLRTIGNRGSKYEEAKKKFGKQMCTLLFSVIKQKCIRCIRYTFIYLV